MSPGDRWRLEFFQRHPHEDPSQQVPAQEFLDAILDRVAATMLAVLSAVCDAPPPAFSGGGYWEAMHGEMSGYYEVRVRRGRDLYRLFCLLDRDAPGLQGPSVVCLTGLQKRAGAAFSGREYGRVRALGDEYRARCPRPVAR